VSPLSTPVLGVIAAALASFGAYLIYTSAVFGWQGIGRRRPFGPARRPGPPVAAWLRSAGLGQVSPAEFAAAVGLLFVGGGLGGFVLFGSVLPAVVAGFLTASVPVSSYRRRRQVRLAAAAETWPRLLEELRLLIGPAGRSIPQALFEVGRRVPAEWSPAFAAAEREWLLSTDFARTTALLKDELADPTVDVVCETLLVAHEVGGADLEARLGDLIEDRVVDLQGRKDAASRQAGVRFARRFVLLVPLGMTLAGLSIGTGRQAYETAGGQLAVVVGLVAVAACWMWSGRLMRLPESRRVFQ
jgi:tight adherence protein B